MKLIDVLNKIPDSELPFLAKILEIESDSSIQQIHDELKRRVYNLPRPFVDGKSDEQTEFISRMRDTHNAMFSQLIDPDYEELVANASKHVRAFVKGSSLNLQEQYFAQGVFVRCLAAMSPHERNAVLSTTVDFSNLAPQSSKASQVKWTGTVTTLGAMGLAQASGFGVYLFASTSLGFLTSSLGVTLPFVAYTSLSSAIAVAIGPLGWAALSAVVLKKVADQKWRKLIPALMFIVAMRHLED